MNDLERWLDRGAPPDVAESLRAARTEAPRRAVVERCVTLVGAAGAVGLSASVAGAASSGAAGKATGVVALAKWGISGFAMGSALMVGVEIADRASPPPGRSRPPAPSIVVTNEVAPRAALPRPVPPPPVLVEAPPPPARVPSLAPSGPSVDERLTAELALLSAVRAAVDRREAGTALALLAEHSRRYQTGAQLLPEARYLRLEALELSGRREEARALARRILDLSPRGPHAARAKEILEIE